MAARTHRDLLVWRKSITLASRVFAATERFPSIDRYGLAAQMRRSAVSVASNIAEGAARSSRAEYIRFVTIARGSLSELETQICICAELKLMDKQNDLETLASEIGRMLTGLVRRLKEHRDRAASFAVTRTPTSHKSLVSSHVDL